MAASTTPTADEETEPTPVAPTSPPEIVVDVPATSPPVPVPASAPTPLVAVPSSAPGPYKPPVLVGASDNPLPLLAGIVGLFLIALLVGLIGPAMQTPNPGERTSAIDFTVAAQDGRHVYMSAGCAACHTQMVRPVVADVGLGAVTLNDTNQVLGTRRFGPDLSNVGARMTTAQITAVVEGLDDHPGHDLSDDAMTALVAYLAESITAEGQ
jgi:hypothetical protein